jgi:hypothetical protein
MMWLLGMDNFSVLQPDLLPSSLLGSEDVPVETGTGGLTDPRFSLQPRRPNKRSQDRKSENTINRTKFKSSVLTIPAQSNHIISFPMLSPIKYGPFTYAFKFYFLIIYFNFINGFNFKMADVYNYNPERSVGRLKKDLSIDTPF